MQSYLKDPRVQGRGFTTEEQAKAYIDYIEGGWKKPQTPSYPVQPQATITPATTATPTVPTLDLGQSAGQIQDYRRQISEGLIDPKDALGKYGGFLLKSYGAEKGFTSGDSEKAYQSALATGKKGLFSDLGTIRTQENQYGNVDPTTGDVIRTSTKLQYSNTGAGGTGTNIYALPSASDLKTPPVPKLQNTARKSIVAPRAGLPTLPTIPTL